MIFDIQRCAMYDGPGIRTVVFLKGCPLSCKWCHNPESQKREKQFAIFTDKCLNCRLCEAVCPSKAHTFASGEHQHHPELCTFCGKCISICPGTALKAYGREAVASEIIDLALLDLSFYQNSGGGLTISGGEPFYQYDFLMELLTAAHKKNLHTCIETSGFTTEANILASLHYTDLYLFDYKLSTEETHKEFTGISNRQILKNLDLLYQNNANIILRCPIIPGVNDTEEHFLSIRQLKRKYPNLRGIELLPYHNLGISKAIAVGCDSQTEYPVPDQNAKDLWNHYLHTIA